MDQYMQQLAGTYILAIPKIFPAVVIVLGLVGNNIMRNGICNDASVD